jgi:hypothetical protein
MYSAMSLQLALDNIGIQAAVESRTESNGDVVKNFVLIRLYPSEADVLIHELTRLTKARTFIQGLEALRDD